MDKAQGIKKLNALVAGIKTAMLTTMEQDGSLRSRPMVTLQVENEIDLWFFTQQHSPKVGEIQHDGQVNLSYAEPAEDRYVSLSGKARIVHDAQKTRELWSEEHRTWYPGGVEDPEIALLRVRIEYAQYWDRSSSTMKAARSGDSTQSENHKLNLG